MPPDKLNDLPHIESYLREQGWPVSEIDRGTLRTSFRCKSGLFPLVIQIEQGWVKLTVLPIARLPAEAAKAERMYEKLLRVNGEIMLARFSLDEDGDVLLTVEFPSNDFDPSEMRDALDVLSFYAERYQPEIKSIVA